MYEYNNAPMAVAGIDRKSVHDGNDRAYDQERSLVEHDNSQTSNTRDCLKKTAKFLFSHIGLVGLVVIYAVAGGFLFELLEQHQEKMNCQEAYGEHVAELNRLKQKLVTYIQYNTTASTLMKHPTAKDNTTVAFATIGDMLYEYRDFILETGSKYRFYGDNCSIVNKWTFPNSLLFSITIITTIGYGNIT
jgi:hypothetical protein